MFRVTIQGLLNCLPIIIPVQILDTDGKSMQHCVENSMEKTAERLTKLDKSGRLVSVVDSPYIQVADPTTMIRQVGIIPVGY